MCKERFELCAQQAAAIANEILGGAKASNKLMSNQEIVIVLLEIAINLIASAIIMMNEPDDRVEDWLDLTMTKTQERIAILKKALFEKCK